MQWPVEVTDYLSGRGHNVPVSQPILIKKAATQFERLLPVLEDLGAAPRSILDIGCGLAITDVFLVRAFEVRTLYLLDGDGTISKEQVGFKPDQQPWNDVAIGAAMVRANVQLDCDVFEVRPAPFEMPADLIVSFRSWGHHYPVSIYIESVKRSLNPGGAVVLDIRQGTDGHAAMIDAGFQMVAQVPDTSIKCGRLVFKRS